MRKNNLIYLMFIFGLMILSSGFVDAGFDPELPNCVYNSPLDDNCLTEPNGQEEDGTGCYYDSCCVYYDDCCSDALDYCCSGTLDYCELDEVVDDCDNPRGEECYDCEQEGVTVSASVIGDSGGLTASIDCDVSIYLDGIAYPDVKAQFYIYTYDGKLIKSSGVLDMGIVDSEDTCSEGFKTYRFHSIMNRTSPSLICEVKITGADSQDGFYNSSLIHDIDQDGYVSFWQANSLGECSGFNSNVEGEDDWPFDDTEKVNKNCPKQQDILDCDSDSDSDGIGDYWNCAHCRNIKTICSSLEQQKFIEKCESGSDMGYWFRAVGWVTNLDGASADYLYRYPNLISDLPCDGYTQIDGVTTSGNRVPSEYLNVRGLVYVIRKAELAYSIDNDGIVPSAREFLIAIAHRMYGDMGFLSDMYIGKENIDSPTIQKLITYINRNPEFYYSARMSGILTTQSGIKVNSYNGGQSVMSPAYGRVDSVLDIPSLIYPPSLLLGASNTPELVPVKTILRDNSYSSVFSISHFAMSAISKYPGWFTATNFFQGTMKNIQNLNGHILGNWARLFNKEMPLSVFIEQRMSSPLIAPVLPEDEIQNWCQLYYQGGGIGMCPIGGEPLW